MVLGFFRLLERGYFDNALLMLGPVFVLQYVFFLLQREFFWCHFQKTLLVFAMFNALFVAIWVQVVEPFYLPNYQ